MAGPVVAHEVRVRVPAKINLRLGVGALRADGYHELRTVFHAVDLVDEVIATPGTGISVSVQGIGDRAVGAVPTDRRNLVWQAAARLAAHAGVEANVHLRIEKRIPVAGGLAGGSADGAAALLACARLWGLDVDQALLTRLAADLGSDTAFLVRGGSALGVGRGESLTPLPSAARLHWVLAVRDVGISAGAAYAELDRLRASGSAPAPIDASNPIPMNDASDATSESCIDALRRGDVADVAATLANDLQPAAISLLPELADTLAAGLGLGALGGVVSGSGPTCAFLCADADAATRVAAQLVAAGSCPAASVATGPAPGAAVVG